MCLEFPAQNRFIIAFPLICGHFSNITNEFCPEEKVHIRERSLSVVNLFLVSHKYIYSNDLKTGHLNSGQLENCTLCVWFSNCHVTKTMLKYSKCYKTIMFGRVTHKLDAAAMRVLSLEEGRQMIQFEYIGSGDRLYSMYTKIEKSLPLHFLLLYYRVTTPLSLVYPSSLFPYCILIWRHVPAK